jgi:hypothetical protein
MFNAVHEGGSAAATMMHIRKWLRILVNRSLVLGTIDRPQLHDLVLDFCVAQHKGDGLRDCHRKVINAFRASRPSDVYGRHGYDLARKDSALNTYVCNECRYHLSQGWQADMENDQLALHDWLGDTKQDELCYAAGSVLGIERMTRLARAAESQGDLWLAARYWSIACVVTSRVKGSAATTETANKALDAAAGYLVKKAGRMSTDELESVNVLELDIFARLACTLDPNYYSRSEAIDRVLQSAAADKEPVAVFLNHVYLSVPLPSQGRISDFGKGFSKATTTLVQAMGDCPDPTLRLKGIMMAYTLIHGLDAMLYGDESFDWELIYGSSGGTLIEAADAYDFDQMHYYLIEYLNLDAFQLCGGTTLPLLLHFGDIRKAQEHIELSITYLRRAWEEDIWGLEFGTWSFCTPSFSMLLYVTRQPAGAYAAVLAEYGFSWENVETKFDELEGTGHPAMRSRGDTTKNVYLFSLDEIIWLDKCASILSSSKLSDDSVNEIISTLPDLAFVRSLQTQDAGSNTATGYNFLK